MAMTEQPTPDEILWEQVYSHTLEQLKGPSPFGGVEPDRLEQCQEFAMQAADRAVARRRAACKETVTGTVTGSFPNPGEFQQ